MENNEPLLIIPMMEDTGFKKHGFCNFHYWNIGQTKCLRCGLEVTSWETETHSGYEMSMEIPMKLPKNKK